MSRSILVVSSVTYSIKGREMLLSHGVKAVSRRIPNLAENGCGWGIEVDAEKGEDAASILAGHGIRVLKIMPASGIDSQ